MTESYGQSPDMVDTAETAGPLAQPRVVAQRYALLAELGRGGMGVVWRGEDRMIGRNVAVKELRAPEGDADASVFQERVLREVRTGGRINDPAVVTVYDVVSEGDATFIVMELVEAPTLSDLVARQGPLPPEQVASIGDQLLSALQTAHEAGIVHRDVKPGNIMVAANGRVKLTDFGIAQAVDDPRLTTSGHMVGSPAFVAPERVAGSEAVPASDLWSLGAALFFAVEGVVAFERTSTAATLHAIMNEVPYLTRVQGPLASVIMGLLISSPDARLSAQQARGLLSMAAQAGQVTPAGGQPMPQAGQTASYPGGNPTMVAGQTMASGQGGPDRGKRNAVLVAAALAGVALLVGGFFVGKWVFEPGADEQMRPTLTYGKDGDIPTVNYAYSNDYCLNTAITPGVGINQSNWIDCDDPHRVEFYTNWNVLGGSSSEDAIPAGYPGNSELKQLAEKSCSFLFRSNDIKRELRGNLEYRALIPTRAEWEKRVDSGDEPTRHFYCVLASANGTQLTGTAQNKLR